MKAFAYIVLLCSLCLFSIQAASGQRISNDGVQLTEDERSQRFYDSMQTKLERRPVSRMFYNLLFEKGYVDTVRTGGVEDIQLGFRRFNGRTIGEIHYITNDIYNKDTVRWVPRTANRLHSTTRPRVIRRDMMFDPGDTFDAGKMVRNIHLLRSRSYLYDVDIQVVPRIENPSIVDIYVITRDSWAWGLDLSINKNGKTKLGVYDANLFGTGNELNIQNFVNWQNARYGGMRAIYEIPNIMGTFYQGYFRIGKRFDKSEITLRVNKDFILPTDYEVGIEYSDIHEPRYLIYADSSMRYEGRYFDVWGGISQYITGVNSSIYLSGHYRRASMGDRPEVAPRFNPYFHEREDALASLGLYRERFLRTSMIYGFGVDELLAAGYKAEIIGGYRWGEFNDYWYTGVNFSMGGFLKRGHYLMGRLGVGSFIDAENDHWNRGIIDGEIVAFSPLMFSGLNRVRQFVTLRYTRGWDRFGGNEELIRFKRRIGPRGFSRHIYGLTRAVITTETVVFTPFQPYRFKIAFFGYADFGVIGSHNSLFDNSFYSTFGIGIRIKNEHLVFNAIQLRLGICVGKGGYVNSNIVSLNDQQRMNAYRYNPTRPEILPFE